MSVTLLSSYFTQKPHPNRSDDPHVVGRMENGHVGRDSYAYMQRWYESVLAHNLNAVVFHDGLSDTFIARYETDRIHFLKAPPMPWSNNDGRFFCFRDYLAEHRDDYIVHTDISDVRLVADPEPVLTSDHDYFACRDTVTLDDIAYQEIHQRYGWDELMQMSLAGAKPVINMGVVGGRFRVMQQFYKRFCEIREAAGEPEQNLNMQIGQYLFRVRFKHRRLLLGEPFTSRFKAYEEERRDVCFIHK